MKPLSNHHYRYSSRRWTGIGGQLLHVILLLPLAMLFQGVRSTSELTTEVQYVEPVEEGPYHGEYLGQLPDLQSIGISGQVYLVNDSAIQIFNFSYGEQAPDLYFWVNKEEDLSSSGQSIPTFEYGRGPLGRYSNAQVVLIIPPGQPKFTRTRSFGLWCQQFAKNFGQIVIPAVLMAPKAQFLDGSINGTRYGVGSGPVLILDRRTVKVYGFTFKGTEAPDGYFYVGKGLMPKELNGVKVPIRGRDSAENITPMKENYGGKQDIILELPESHDIYQIDWISVYCIQFQVDFGHINVRNLTGNIPPYVPPQKVMHGAPRKAAWDETILLGKGSRRNFTFQLGPPGGFRGYQAVANVKPNEYVWYVNGLMTPKLYLKRGVTYNFIVEGGNDPSTENFYNPLYLSEDPFGGYSKLQADEKSRVRVFAGMNVGPSRSNQSNQTQKSVGRLCLWSQQNSSALADDYDDFKSYQHSLQLSCVKGSVGHFSWTPTRETPDLVYYQSKTHYNMGWKIMIVDVIPPSIPDMEETPYKYHIWLEHNLVTKIPRQPSLYENHSHTIYSIHSHLFTFISTILLSCAFIPTTTNWLVLS